MLLFRPTSSCIGDPCRGAHGLFTPHREVNHSSPARPTAGAVQKKTTLRGLVLRGPVPCRRKPSSGLHKSMRSPGRGPRGRDGSRPADYLIKRAGRAARSRREHAGRSKRERRAAPSRRAAATRRARARVPKTRRPSVARRGCGAAGSAARERARPVMRAWAGLRQPPATTPEADAGAPRRRNLKAGGAGSKRKV